MTELERIISEHKDETTEYGKTIKSLQNEKAVLSAAVEARDSKLSKMTELRHTVDDLVNEVKQGELLREKLVCWIRAFVFFHINYLASSRSNSL